MVQVLLLTDSQRAKLVMKAAVQARDESWHVMLWTLYNASKVF